MRDEKLSDFLAHQQISWQFNLSRAPWWGGQFERMVGLVKGAMRKSIGNAQLTHDELKEVLLDVEVALNNRPLSYVEEDVQLPVLTPNSMLYTQPNSIPEMPPITKKIQSSGNAPNTYEDVRRPCGDVGRKNIYAACGNGTILNTRDLHAV